MVPVGQDHPFHPVHDGRGPRRVVAGDVAAADPVGLQVALVDHVEAQLVAQVVEPLRVRVVGAPDRVDVQPLGRQQVLPVAVLGDGPAVVGVEVVPVDPVERDRGPVDEQLAVGDPQGPDPGADPQHLAGLGRRLPAGRRGAQQGHHLVEVRGLRSPGGGHGDLDRDPGHRLADRGHPDHGGPARPAVLPAGLAQQQVDLGVDGSISGVGHRHLGDDGAVTGGLVQGRTHLHVGHGHDRLGEEVDRSEDPAEEPHVLVLEVRAVGVAPDHGREPVGPRPQPIGQVELGRGERSLRVADLLAVQVQQQPRLHPLEDHRDPPARPALRHLEGAPVHAGLVARLVDPRDAPLVDGRRVGVGQVDRHAVAVQLPQARDGQAPAALRSGCSRRMAVEADQPVDELEVPLAGQVQAVAAMPMVEVVQRVEPIHQRATAPPPDGEGARVGPVLGVLTAHGTDLIFRTRKAPRTVTAAPAR